MSDAASKRVIALILGGGQGTRLFPLTKDRSKPAVPIGGKYRLIDIPISNCLHSNIKNIYVLTQFNSESLNNHINNTYRFDYFSRAFVRILSAEQTLDNTNWFQGTADAVRKNLFHLDLKGDEEVLILSGDHLYEMDYRELINYHRKMNADFTVSAIPVRQNETKEFGILKIAKSGRISSFREKPSRKFDLKGLRVGGSYLASMGVYIFNINALKRVLKESGADFGREIIPHSIKSMKGFAYVFNGFWKDVGTIKSYYDVNMQMAASRLHFSFFYEGQVFTRPRFLPPVRVANCGINKALLAEGCVLSNARITGSIIGLRTIIGNKCRIEKSVVMGADYYEGPGSNEPVRLGIGDGSVIRKAIIDKNARIGRNVTITNDKGLKNFDGDNYYIRDGIVVITKNAVIRDGAKI